MYNLTHFSVVSYTIIPSFASTILATSAVLVMTKPFVEDSNAKNPFGIAVGQFSNFVDMVEIPTFVKEVAVVVFGVFVQVVPGVGVVLNVIVAEEQIPIKLHI